MKSRVARWFASAGIAFGILMAAAAPGHAQSNCAPHQLVVDRLIERFGETPQFVGLGSNNLVVEVFASAETGTWTITVTGPEGRTCVVAVGRAFEALERDMQVEGDPT